MGRLGSDKAAVRGTNRKSSSRSGTNEVGPGADRGGIQSWAMILMKARQHLGNPVVTACHSKKLANGLHLDDD